MSHSPRCASWESKLWLQYRLVADKTSNDRQKCRGRRARAYSTHACAHAHKTHTTPVSPAAPVFLGFLPVINRQRPPLYPLSAGLSVLLTMATYVPAGRATDMFSANTHARAHTGMAGMTRAVLYRTVRQCLRHPPGFQTVFKVKDDVMM